MVKTVADIIKEVSGSDPVTEHKIVYDSPTETLEPVYFFILDLMNDFGLNAEKIVDNFSSSPGSGHFGELGQRASIMQQQGTKIMGDLNTVLRSILNLLYDLRDFKTRLQSYNDYHSSNTDTSEAAKLALKQIWLDKVDINKGNSSVKAMALGQANFVTLLDAFLAAKDEKHANKLDLNDRVKRIVVQRIHEFNIWLNQSEEELKKRYKIERAYLKSQVESLKLYSRWAKPYLRAAKQLEAKESNSASLVKTFNTIILELTLLGKSKLNVIGEAGDTFPIEFKKLKTKRDYFACVLVDFNFRGIPQKTSQRGDYVFGGRAEITFRGYALNSDELEKIDKEMINSDLKDVFDMQDHIGEGFEQIKDEIDFFLNEQEEESGKSSSKSKDSSNPFLALIGHYDKPEKKTSSNNKQEKEKKISKDNWYEKNFFRPYVKQKAEETAFSLFDIYKKSHKMQSYT